MHEMNDKYEQKNPFTVPAGYFDSLAGRLAGKVKRPSRRARALAPFAGWVALVAITVLVARWGFTGAGETPAAGLDADFNPTREEILEYLALETDLTLLSNAIME
ncbi:MAG: hypothetical protein LBK12_05375 [Odoribacteraceae bacterium]|jgi:hypothetical protein|nr:hypothetical protein [Odoribacteraceae bacterium]